MKSDPPAAGSEDGQSADAPPPGENGTMSLATLFSRELTSMKIHKQTLEFGQASQSKKGEDFYLMKTDCQRVPGDASTTFSVFAIFDGHNGRAAAIYSKENLLKDVMSAIPGGVSRTEWLTALPRAMVAGFVRTDKEFQKQEQSSGTTVTLVVIDAWTVTVASVGDSRCILEPKGGAITMLTVDHRLEENTEERDRIKASGGEVGRLSTVGGAEIGPLRCWPGGLCLSRSIGDMDVGEFIVPIPHVKQIKLSPAGGRLIVASDGVWDALSSEKAAKCCRGLPALLSAKQIVKEALRTRGLRDDTTCLVVDIVPTESSPAIGMVKKKKNKFLSSLFGIAPKSPTAKLARKQEVGNVEEIFEEGSAMLSERLGSQPTLREGTRILLCAICQLDITPPESLSVNGGSFFSSREGPFLCISCKQKQDAMEGKRASRKLWVG